MPSNKNRLNTAKLYLILDAQVLDHASLLKALKESVRFGIDIVQLRDKINGAKDILAFCHEAKAICRGKALFIVNDRVDVSLLAGADGVHVGQDDISYAQARRLLGPKALIGVSCQNWAQAQQAQKDGADYIGFGSVFKTKTKPDRHPMDIKLLQQVWQGMSIPVFPIGGISRGNISVLADQGIARVAVCRDILLAKNMGKSIREFQKILRG